MSAEYKTSITSLNGAPASSLGLGAYEGQDSACVPRAYEGGINYFFFYGLNQGDFVGRLKPLILDHREELIVASGSGARTRRGLVSVRQKILKAAGLEMLDVFFAEYINPDDDREQIFGDGGVLDELQHWKSAGLIRYVGATAHNRELARDLALDPRVDVLMHRFNMAHRKAAQEVFPSALKAGTPVVAFTATRWGTLLDPPQTWRASPPSAADCYRYCLAQPAVRVVLTAPRDVGELEQNITVLHDSPMDSEQQRASEAYGELVAARGTSAFETRWP